LAFPFKRILAPVDFDPSSLKALEMAAKLAQQNDATVFVLHIAPVDIDVSGMPTYTCTHRRRGDAQPVARTTTKRPGYRRKSRSRLEARELASAYRASDDQP
jgi:nucleotide-binding universal stress UspA family protein